MADDDAPWTSLVVAQGEHQRHGLDPQDPETTLCRQVAITPETLYRGCFYGAGGDDCPRCAALLPENHF